MSLPVNIKDFSRLLTSIETILLSQLEYSQGCAEPTYQYPWDNYSIGLKNGSPEEIVSIQESGKYHVLIRNNSSQKAYLYLPGGKINNDTAWVLFPGELMELFPVVPANKSFHLFGKSTDCNLTVTIHSELEKNTGEKIVSAPLIIEKLLGTGDSFCLSNSYHYKLDSRLGITGHKLLKITSFDLSRSNTEGYAFDVSIDQKYEPAINFDDGNFLEVHEITVSLLLKIRMWQHSYWINEYLEPTRELPRDKNPETWRCTGKKIGNNYKLLNYPVRKDDDGDRILDDKIILRPNHSTFGYILKVKTDDGFQIAVIDYDGEKKTIKVLGV